MNISLKKKHSSLSPVSFKNPNHTYHINANSMCQPLDIKEMYMKLTKRFLSNFHMITSFRFLCTKQVLYQKKKK